MKINTINNQSKIFLVIIIPAIFLLSIFIVEGAQWIGDLNYYIVIASYIGFCSLIITKARDQLLIITLIFFLTFNADYPLIYHPQIAGGTRPTPVIWLVDFPLLILVGKYFLKGRHCIRSLKFEKRFIVLLLIFILWEAITIINALDYRSVIFQIIKDIRYFSIFIVLLLYIDNDIKKLKFVIIILFCAIVFQNSWGVLQFIKQSTFNISVLGESPSEGINLDIIESYTGDSFQIFGLKFGKYISGFTGSPYSLARENLLLFPLFLSMYLSRIFIFNRLIHAIGIFLLFIGLMFGFSKSVWISAFVATTILYSMEIKHKRITLPKICFSALFSFFALAIFGRFLYLRIFKTNLSSSFNSRVLLNDFGLDKFLDFPLTGVGSNNIWIYFLSSWGLPTTVHNLYILYLCEIGLIGFIIFVFILFFIFLKTVNIEKTNTLYYALSVGLISSISAFYWDQLWTWLYRSNPVGCLFWVLSAVSFATRNIQYKNC